MQRIVSFVLAFIVLIIMTSCGGDIKISWQEQYDLGMRYLSESSYEEAIIAFVEAIAIDPMYAETYVYLVQANMALGNLKEAEEFRIQGYEATGDARLSRSILNEWNLYDATIPFEQRIIYRDFNLLSTEHQEAIRQMIEAVQDEELQTTQNLLSGGMPPLLCTMTDGYQIEIMLLDNEKYWDYYQAWQENEKQKGNQIVEQDDLKSVQSMLEELRYNQIRIVPENGISYTCYQSFSMMNLEADGLENEGQTIETKSIGLTKTECQNWIENGITTTESEMLIGDGKGNFLAVSRTESSGVKQNGILLSGTARTITPIQGEPSGITEYEYKDGRIATIRRLMYENGVISSIQEMVFNDDGTMITYLVNPETGERINMEDFMNQIMNMTQELDNIV